MRAGKKAFSQFTCLHGYTFLEKIFVEGLRLSDENVRLPPVYVRVYETDIYFSHST